jgi:regulator of replication initiation timing
VSVQQILVSDNSGSSLNLSNSNRTASSEQSWLYHSIESRLKKLETSVSVESVRDQVTDLHKEVEFVKSDLGKLQEENARVLQQNAELQTRNARILQHNAELQKENADLKAHVVSDMLYLVYLNTSFFLQSDFRDRLAAVERFLRGKATALCSNLPLTKLEGESVPRLGSPQPIDEAKTPKPDTTPKASPRHLEVAPTSENTGAQDSRTPYSLPTFSPLPPPNAPTDPVEIRPTSQLGGQTPSGSCKSRPSPASSNAHSLGISRKRGRDPTEEPGLAELDRSVALGASPPSPKRVKPNEQEEGHEEEEELGHFTTPPNPQPANAFSTPSRPAHPFHGGSPSPQRQPPLTSATGNSNTLRPKVHGMELVTPVGDDVPGAPAPVVAVPLRGDNTRLTPEPAPGRAGTSHTAASSALANVRGGIFHPPSSSTPARPAPRSLLLRPSTATSRIKRGPKPHDRHALISAPPPPTIPAWAPAEGPDSGGSQSSDGANSIGAERPALVPAPVETEPATPNRAAGRLGRGMQSTPGAQSRVALDPLRFTGGVQVVRGRANPTSTPMTPDQSVRQAASETPMASSTRYGTEIKPSMPHFH